MGSYWTLSVEGFDILDGKNSIDGQIQLLFSKKDLSTKRRNASSEDGGDYERYQYVCTVGELRDRLDLMGFGMSRAITEFNSGRATRLENAIEVNRDSSEPDELVAFLEDYTFDKWAKAMVGFMRRGRLPHIESRTPHTKSVGTFISEYSDDGVWLGFFCTDLRSVLRACLHLLLPTKLVILDLTDILNLGYLEGEPDLADLYAQSALEYSRTTPIIVLTEGTTDCRILRGTLPLIYPHLVSWFTFMDFDLVHSQGSAGHLVNIVKAFVGSGIRNRVVAIFDNDTAAHVALKGLKEVKLPNNMRAITLPRIAIAAKYPTEGPQGRSNADVNGRACSIEFFLGEDVLGPKRNWPAVRWTGYDQSLRQYQGELVNKRDLQEKFFRKLKTASPKTASMSEWRELRHLWSFIRSEAELISVDITEAAHV